MISFVIPALDEQASIANTVRNCLALAADRGWHDAEVVVVNDGSTDHTASLAAEAGAKVIHHPAPGGYGRSLKDGINAARHDTIVTLDADGTYPISSVPDLVARYEQGFDMVVGQRTGKAYRESVLKSPLRFLLRTMVEFTTGTSIPDINSGLRVFSRRTIATFFPRLCDTFSFSTSTTLAYLMTGKFVSYITIDYFDRVGKSKVRLFRDSLRTLQFIVHSILFYNPLKLFLMLAASCFCLALLLMFCAFLTQFVSIFLLGVGTGLLSILVFAMGLLAVQLKEIMHR